MTKKVIKQFMKEQNWSYFRDYLDAEDVIPAGWSRSCKDDKVLGLAMQFTERLDKAERTVHMLMSGAAECAQLMIDSPKTRADESALKHRMHASIKACEELVGLFNMRRYFQQYPEIQKVLSEVYILHSRYEPDFLKRMKGGAA